MRPHSLILTVTLLVAAANAASEDNAARRGGLGGGASRHESVSSEPLTFDAAAPETVDRERLLAEAGAPDEDERPYEVMEGMDLFEGEEVWGSVDGGEWDEEDGEYVDGDFGEDEDIIDYDEGEEFDYGEETNEHEPSFDSTYESEDGGEFFVREGDEVEGDGAEEVGEPLGFEEPIARRLRRVTPSVKKEADEERYLAEKESFRDESIPLFEPIEDENGEFDLTPYAEPEYLEELGQLSFDEHDGRDLQAACSSGEKRVQVEIVTDKSGFETSWEIEKVNGALVTKGPPGNTKYADSKRYVGKICLAPGSYRFTVHDKFRDGMCGANTGNGLYRFYIAGAKKFTSPADCNLNWGKRVHTFNIAGANNNNGGSTNNGGTAGAISGRGGCTNVKIQFKVDKYGKETTVKLTGGGKTHLQSVKNVGAYQTKTLTKCVPPGTYQLRLVDQDGICCSNGQGWYKMFVRGKKVISGGYFVGSKTHTIKVGFNWQASMNAREKQWLNGHNSRRRTYNGGKGYVPLKWSKTLQADAMTYAKQLARDCSKPLSHAKGIQDGENLAKNKGSGRWGQLYPVDNIMRRFVENELTWPYPRNAHYTQVVWRATEYVGCAETATKMANRQTCRVQVCRYARAGNCNVRNGNWRAEAFKDSTACGRPCPKEGCFV